MLYFVWFALGAFCAEFIRNALDHARGVWLLWLVPLEAIVMLADLATHTNNIAIRFGSGVLGIATVLVASAVVSRRIRFLARPNAWLGRQTLSIYVLHLPLVALWASFVWPLVRDGFPASSPAIVTAYMVALSALIIGVSAGIGRLIRRYAPVLFVPPWLLRSPKPGLGDASIDRVA